MKKFNFTIVILVLFILAVSGKVLAGDMERIDGDIILTPEEESGLMFMREEEKLARDVYLFLSEKWGLKIFKNISKSEQQHMNAVLYLIEKYGLSDPALEPGYFQDDELQILYDELVAKGEISVTDAFEVGVLIEETDIDDIEYFLSGTEKNDIINVYTNLLNGSYKHLSAFEYHLDYGPAPNSHDGHPDGSGFEEPPPSDKVDGVSVGPAPNSGDGIPDGSGM